MAAAAARLLSSADVDTRQLAFAERLVSTIAQMRKVVSQLHKLLRVFHTWDIEVARASGDNSDRGVLDVEWHMRRFRKQVRAAVFAGRASITTRNPSVWAAFFHGKSLELENAPGFLLVN